MCVCLLLVKQHLSKPLVCMLAHCAHVDACVVLVKRKIVRTDRGCLTRTPTCAHPCMCTPHGCAAADPPITYEETVETAIGLARAIHTIQEMPARARIRALLFLSLPLFIRSLLLSNFFFHTRTTSHASFHVSPSSFLRVSARVLRCVYALRA